MANFPKDRFDEIPDGVQRVGAHRAPASRARGWIGFGWAALATLVLVVVGVFALSLLNEDFRLPFFQAQEEEPSVAPTVSDEPEAEPALDPEVAITVLNGTPMAGLATTVGDELVAKGWGGAALGIGSRANASDRDIDDTVVYYGDPSLEGAARQLVIDLGVGEIRLSDDFPNSPVTIVLGADYRPVTPSEPEE